MLNLTLPQVLVILSAILMLIGGYACVRDTLLGTTKPNRVSWFLWALAPLISVGAAMSSDADIWPTVRVIVGGIVPATVFLASFVNRESYWKLTRFDLACGALSLLALIFWMLADSPLIAILLATTSNTLASIPTMLKAWKYPETETKLIYITSFVSTVIMLPSIPVWNIENSAFQLSLLITTGILMAIIFRPQPKLVIEEPTD